MENRHLFQLIHEVKVEDNCSCAASTRIVRGSVTWILLKNQRIPLRGVVVVAEFSLFLWMLRRFTSYLIATCTRS
jgi:hypothetical protein